MAGNQQQLLVRQRFLQIREYPSGTFLLSFASVTKSHISNPEIYVRPLPLSRSGAVPQFCFAVPQVLSSALGVP